MHKLPPVTPDPQPVLWGFYHIRFLVVFTWSSPGHHPVITRSSPWSSPGHHLVVTWSSPGHHLVVTWSSPGHHLVITWSSPGY
ncbi:hypothetical protein NHX12_010505 [Muraenolepis orangiensis]|uniref:Uncharacterized protein n=1 Tax=Muraenolepis orangiensis TaxID=630683 RepID=A0A9Q0I7C4_9TELE|nr:hypothetical protein NHX12_010505 [Muraenolepis orangiensis]